MVTHRPYQGEVDGTERDESLSKPVRHLVTVLLGYRCLGVLLGQRALLRN